MDWELWVGEVETARATFARLIGAEVDEVAVASSVSQAVSSLSSALTFEQPRHTIVLTEAEFPTVGQVWSAQERRGAHTRWVPMSDGRVDPARLAEAIGDDTVIVSATHGAYQTGALLDLAPAAEAARRHGALLFVDAYQTLGALEVNVRDTPVDALAAGNLKYLMGLPGIAFLYVRREVAETLEPTVTGWFGRADPFGFDARDRSWGTGARRFDLGTPPILPAYVARAGMEMLESVGLDAVTAWNRALASRLIDGGRQRGLTLMGPDDPRARTPSTAFAVRRALAVEKALRTRGVIASARGPAIRLAPHFYNTLEDVERALDALVEVLREHGA